MDLLFYSIVIYLYCNTGKKSERQYFVLRKNINVMGTDFGVQNWSFPENFLSMAHWVMEGNERFAICKENEFYMP